MESDHNEASEPCQHCKQRPVTTTYANRSGKWTEEVCASCLDFLQMREAFEWGVLDTRPLAEEERYDELLAWIDTFNKTNRHRDQNAWLAKAVAEYRQLTLWEAGRYEEALQACDAIEKLGFDNVTDRWSLAGARARVYEDMGRHAEALAIFEEAFREQDPRYLSGASYYMRPLAEFSTNAGQPVDESWRELAQRIADHYKVEFPVRPTLAESMQALFEITHPEAKQIDDE